MDRKRHLERARERKNMQQEFLMRRAQNGGDLDQQEMRDLVDRKTAKLRNQQLFDQFTTIQEFLAHGTRSVEEPQRLGILSVTTV